LLLANVRRLPLSVDSGGGQELGGDSLDSSHLNHNLSRVVVEIACLENLRLTAHKVFHQHFV
jgi:hypothetical protein